MPNKYMKKLLTLFVNMKMQIKTTIICYSTLGKLAKFKKA